MLVSKVLQLLSPSSPSLTPTLLAVLIRALHELYIRSDNNDLKTLAHSYIDVQYNALLDLTANGDTYSSSWTGPAQDYTAWGQLAALDPLMAAIRTND